MTANPHPNPLIAYLVHDLGDAGVRRRIRMFRAGGARTSLAGFHRDEAPREVDGLTPLPLGQTHDARLLSRALSVARVCAIRIAALRKHFAGADVIVARNLEMLAIAARAVSGMHPRPRLIYECLDIHRLLFGSGVASRALRAMEARLLRQSDLVLTSSPDFASRHFARVPVCPPVHLVENKVLGDDGPAEPASLRPPGPPWRIGWFGMIRCARSLDMLTALAARHAGAVEIVIRGKPAESAIPDFSERVARAPHVSFGGPYRNPEDLGAIYGGVDFAWTVDFYEEGQNSEWLLPNRLYEGCLHGAVPIALSRTCTGRVLSGLGTGHLLGETPEADLERLFANLRPEAFAADLRRLRAIPRTRWIADEAECRELVALVAQGHPHRIAA